MPSSFILSLMLNLLLLSTVQCNNVNKSHNKIILINTHHHKTTVVRSLTCIMVVLFLSFLFKMFAAHWIGCSGGGRGQRNVNVHVHACVYPMHNNYTVSTTYMCTCTKLM